MQIEIVSFKRDKYDRGSKKIMVNGAEWGWIKMESHGMHGPSYHAHDKHGPVFVGKTSEARFKPDGIKSIRWKNVGKPQHEKIGLTPTDEQLRSHVEKLITDGHLRAPDVRAAEIKAAKASYIAEREAGEKAETAALVSRAKDIVAQMQRGACGKHLENEIIDAMRWAQTR